MFVNGALCLLCCILKISEELPFFNWNHGEYYIGMKNNTWQEATDFCRLIWGKDNGDLVSIEDSEENSYIHKIIKDLGSKSFYIGASDTKQEGKWIWNNKCPFKYTHWRKDETVNNHEKDCAYILRSSSEWHDEVCVKKMWFICERKNPEFRCDKTVFEWQGGNYILEKSPSSWWKAKEFCHEFWGPGNGHLATIYSVHVNEYLHKIVQNFSGKSVFIGGNDIREKGKWFWDEKCPFVYTNWNTGSPKKYLTFGSSDDCIELMDSSGKWNNVDCNKNMSFICERKRTDMQCGVSKKNSNIADDYYIAKFSRTWQKAKKYCFDFLGPGNADLLIIEDDEENENIIQMLRNLGNRHVHIGASYSKEMEKWLWNDGCSFQYTNWENVGQINLRDKENCAKFEGGSGKWNSVDCDSKLWFVCERKRKDQLCGEPIFNWNGVQYYLGKKSTTWNDAKLICNDLWGKGIGDLATIDDANENEYVYRIVKSYGDKCAFIGGNKINKRNWLWSDTCPFKFEYWDSHSSNDHADKNCAVICTNNGKWRVESCQTKGRFVCERKKPDLYCSESFLDWNGGQYYFGKVRSTWLEAKDFCRKLWGLGNGDLVTIDDEHENKYVNKLNKETDSYTFIGGNDIEKEGTWIWKDKCPLMYSNWNEKEPSHYNGNGKKEDCLSLSNYPPKWYILDFKIAQWNDHSCDDKLTFICERKRSDLHCGEPFYNWNGNQYYVAKLSYNWYEARDFCRGLWGYGDGDLVTIYDAYENEYIFGIMKSKNIQTMIIGAHDSIVEGKWIWSDNCSFKYSNWNPGEPNDIKNEDCAEMDGKSGKWNDVHCSTKNRFVCERTRWDLHCDRPLISMEIDLSDEPFFNWNGGHYYVGKKLSTWIEARTFCRELWGLGNGDLVTIDDATENEYLYRLIGKNDGLEHTFIGGNDIEHDGKWIWSDRCPFKFTNWDLLQPDNKEHNCLALTYGVGKWNDMSCNVKRYFICERKKFDVHCGEPFYKWNGNQYYLERLAYTWTDARDHCRELWGPGDGDLVTIDDEHENEFLYGIMKKRSLNKIIIGTNDFKEEGKWIWSDNSPFIYSNWWFGEPNNLNDEDCAVIDGVFGRWYDMSCNEKKWFFCERSRLDHHNDRAVISLTLNASGDPFFDWNGGHYYLGKKLSTWKEARDFCRGLWGVDNGDLASIDDASENEYLFRMIGKTDAQEHTYIGGNKIETENVWIWSDQCPFQYTNWDLFQPEHKNDENCLVLTYGFGKWDDTSCLVNRYFICERKRPDFLCGDQIYHWNGNQYYIGRSTYNWAEARDVCRKLWGPGNGDLVSINDFQENEYLRGIMKKRDLNTFIIGAHDHLEEGKWIWSDNCSFKFTNWKSGEPNNDKDEDCGLFEMKTGKWNDVLCSTKSWFVCKRARRDSHCDLDKNLTTNLSFKVLQNLHGLPPNVQKKFSTFESEIGTNTSEHNYYWIGLKNLHNLTFNKNIGLQIRLFTEKDLFIEQYRRIKVGPASDGYRLYLEDRHNLSNATLPGMKENSNSTFTVPTGKSGWWYSHDSQIALTDHILWSSVNSTIIKVYEKVVMYLFITS